MVDPKDQPLFDLDRPLAWKLGPDGRTPVPVDATSATAWAEPKQLAMTDLGVLGYCSTSFLGNDHNFMGRGPPVLFETMILDHPFGYSEPRLTSEYSEFWELRTTTWLKAHAQHRIVLRSFHRFVIENFGSWEAAETYARLRR